MIRFGFWGEAYLKKQEKKKVSHFHQTLHVYTCRIVHIVKPEQPLDGTLTSAANTGLRVYVEASIPSPLAQVTVRSI